MTIDNYPFPYFGHGNTRPWDWMMLVACFRDIVSEEQHKAIKRGIPKPLCPGSLAERFSGLGMTIHWDERFFVLSNTVEIMHDVLEHSYRGNWTKFQKRVDTWLTKIHKKYPIQFVLREWAEGEPSSWHEWSVTQLGEKVFPVLLKYSQNFEASEKQSSEYNPVQDLIQYQLLPYFEEQLDYFGSSPQLTQDLINLLQWLPSRPENSDQMIQKSHLVEQLCSSLRFSR